MSDLDDRLRASLAGKADAWTPAAPPLPAAAGTGAPRAVIAVAAVVGAVLAGGVLTLATHGTAHRATLSAAPALPTLRATGSPLTAISDSPASLPSAGLGPIVAATPGGAHGPTASPSPSSSPSTSSSPTQVTHTLGPPSNDYALHADLLLSGGTIELIPSRVPPLATVRQAMLAYRAMFTSQAAYAASKPTYKYGVLWKSAGVTSLEPRIGTVVWIVGNDSQESVSAGPPGAKRVTGHGAYSLYTGATAAPLIGFEG